MGKMTSYPAAVPAAADIMAFVDDPSGTPATKKATLAALTKAGLLQPAAAAGAGAELRFKAENATGGNTAGGDVVAEVGAKSGSGADGRFKVRAPGAANGLDVLFTATNKWEIRASDQNTVEIAAHPTQAGPLSLRGNGGDQHGGYAFIQTAFRQEGLLVLSSKQTPAALAADANNYAGVPSCFFGRVSASGAHRTLTGLSSASADSMAIVDTAGGMTMILRNVGATYSVVLAHEHASSTAANRFSCPGGMSVVLRPGDAALLFYDATAARWVVLGVRSDTALVTPATLSASVNDYDFLNARMLRVATNGSGAKNITGLLAGVDGQRIDMLINVGTDSITLKHQDAGSAAANRIICTTGADIALATDKASSLVYDGTTQRWRAF